MSVSIKNFAHFRLAFIAFGALLLAASLLASPIIQASLVAGLSGLAGFAALAFGFTPGGEVVMPVPPPPVQIVHRVVEQPKDFRVYRLDNGKGYVVFQVVDGKLISKLVDAAFVSKMLNNSKFSG